MPDSLKKQFYRLPEACGYLGIAHSSMYNHVNKQKIEAIKTGKHLYFTKEALDNFILNNGVVLKTKQDIEAKAEAYILKEAS